MLNVSILFSSGQIGGAERSLTRMALASEDPEIRYRVSTLGQPGPWTKWAESLGLNPEAYGLFDGNRMRCSAVLRFLRSAVVKQADIIYAVGIRAATVVRLARPWLKKSVIVHGIRSGIPEGSTLARKFGISEKLLHKWTDHYIANTETGAIDLRRIVPQVGRRITVIHNGVSAPETRSGPFDERPQQVAVVANLHALKCHVEFLDVIQAVVRQLPDAHFVFVGRDDMRGMLHRKVDERGLRSYVEIVGFRENPDEIVRNSRVFALPSLVVEGCPTAVLEAMALGVPPVAYRVGGLGEVITSGVNGMLVSPGDSVAFADALVRLLTDERFNTDCGARAIESISRTFSLSACAQKHAETWRQLCANAERARSSAM